MRRSDGRRTVVGRSSVVTLRRRESEAVAEGVEARASVERLTALGCDELQGFLLGRPMPVEQLTRQLDRPPDSAATPGWICKAA